MPAPESGDFLPMFIAPSSMSPQFHYDTLGGMNHLLVFLGSAQTPLGARMVDTLVAMQPVFQRTGLYCFIVAADPRDREGGRLQPLIDRYVVLWDFDRSIHRAAGMLGPEPAGGGAAPMAMAAVVVQRNLRVHTIVPAAPIDSFADRCERGIASLPQTPAPTAMGFQAPVLIVPDVLDKAFCQHLISQYETAGGVPSGYMQDEGGITREFSNARMKRRQDHWIEDRSLLARLKRRLHARVIPEIRKAFCFDVTEIERFVVGCYDASDQGFFSMHRDNTQLGTAHRRFATTINLNAEDYEGGELWFPEYGPMMYKAPTGSAVVFSCSLLHEVRPVTKGRRYAFLPFLYDEAAAEIRKRNSAFLDLANGGKAATVTPVQAPAS